MGDPMTGPAANDSPMMNGAQQTTLPGYSIDTETAIEAIRMLKDTCYKLDIHLMPNLPGQY